MRKRELKVGDKVFYVTMINGEMGRLYGTIQHCSRHTCYTAEPMCQVKWDKYNVTQVIAERHLIPISEDRP